MPHSDEALREAIRGTGTSVGLDDIAITSADPLDRAQALATWLAHGHHGSMAYLERGDRHRPERLLEGAQTVVMACVRYARDPDPASPIAAYAQRPDYHFVLKEALERLATALRDLVPGSQTRVAVDTAPFLEREAAQRAGLGWVGKSTMLVHRQFGCFTLLGELLWTHALTPDAPEVDHCGTCTRCLDACPTDALTHDRPYHLDATRCLSYLTIETRGHVPEDHRDALGTRAFGCDACIDVCPWGRADVEQESRLLPTEPSLRGRPLLDLLDDAEAHFKQSFGWTPVERTRKLGLLRGLLFALGNSEEEGVEERAREFLGHEDASVREAAAWAVERQRLG